MSETRSDRTAVGIAERGQAGEAAVVHVNGEATPVPLGCTLERLLENLDMRDRRVAVARNHAVVPRTRYASEVLDPDDRIEILEAVGGG